MNTRSLRFARRMGESYPCPKYANPIEMPQPRRRLSRPFWIAACFAACVVIAFAELLP